MDHRYADWFEAAEVVRFGNGRRRDEEIPIGTRKVQRWATPLYYRGWQSFAISHDLPWTSRQRLLDNC